MFLLKVVYIIIITILVKLVLNLFRLKRLQSLYGEYKNYLNSHREGKVTYGFYEKKREIIELLKQAGVKSSTMIKMSPLYPGYASKNVVDLFENMAVYDDEVCNLMIAAFNEAIGVYKKRLIDSINPLFWIECIVFLPQHIYAYLTTDSVAEKNIWLVHLLNFIYWLLGFAGSVISVLTYFKR